VRSAVCTTVGKTAHDLVLACGHHRDIQLARVFCGARCRVNCVCSERACAVFKVGTFAMHMGGRGVSCVRADPVSL
jgi:hypothetical protein